MFLHQLNQKIVRAIAVFLSIVVLSACSGGNSDVDAENTANTSGGIDTGDTSSDTAVDSTGNNTDGVTQGGAAGSTDGVSQGNTAGTTDGDTQGAVAGESDGATQGDTVSSTAGDSQGDTTGSTGGDTQGSGSTTMNGSTQGNTAGATDGNTDGVTQGDTSGSTGSATNGELNTPVVRAPSDSVVVRNESLELDGSVTFNGMPLDIPVILWNKFSGPGTVTFSNAQSAKSSASFDTAGTYLIQLNAANGPFVSSDIMEVVVTETVINQPPKVMAGPNETLKIDEVLNLAAQVEDDGLPTSNLSGQWSKYSGPGEATFGEPSALNTTVTFSAIGDYVIRYTSNDGELSANDSIDVTVNAAPVVNANNNVNAANQWQLVTTSNGSKPQARHEAAAVAFQNRLYLIGGRGIRQVNRYNPANNSWENLGSPGLELSHFQPVVYGGKIYVLGSLDCCFPRESVIAAIQIFNPANKTWSQGASLPVNRRRGSAGVVVRDNKIYMIGGSTNGHDGGMVNWFDEYNPASNSWKTLPNAPNKRDHFSAAIVGNKLVAAGGRKTDHPATFANLVTAVDVYDFGTGQWQNGTPIPTKRAGAMTVSYGDEVILIGGETDSGIAALKTVEAYNVKTNSWRSLNSLGTARHSGGAAIVGGAIHVVSGNLTTGGGAETQIHEKLNLE